MTLLCGAAALLTPARAQQPRKVHRIGIMHVGDHLPPGLRTLRERLDELGYKDGKNIEADFHNLPGEEAADQTARNFGLARVEVIVAFGDPAIRAAKNATSDIPIVMLHATDPVAQGFVQSLGRPGGNVTGFVFFAVSPAKHVELFKEIVPRLRHLLVLADPGDPTTASQLSEMRNAAGTLGLRLLEREATGQADLERVFSSFESGDIDGVVSASLNLQIKFTAVLIRLARSKRVPLASYRKESVEEGALFSYAPDASQVGRRAADYIDMVLKGAKPEDLPVEQPTKFQLVINLKAAKALGITVPPTLLARADEVIE